jgi:hypothetical protein
MGWTVRGSNSGGDEIFRTHPYRPRVPRSLLYNGYLVSSPGVKRPGRGVNQPLLCSAEVKKRVELYVYYPSGPSWPVVRRNLPFYVSRGRLDGSQSGSGRFRNENNSLPQPGIELHCSRCSLERITLLAAHREADTVRFVEYNTT